MHARGVHPDEERLVVLGVLVDVVQRRAHGLVVDRFHALGGEGAGVLDLAVGRGLDHAARLVGRDDGILGILRPVGAFRLFFGVQVIEVAEEHIEAVLGRQVLVAVAEVVLAELRGVVAMRLERLRDGDVAILQAHRGARHADLGQAGAAWRLARDEARPSGRAAVLRVVVREYRAFLGDAVDVRRGVADHAAGVGADVRLPDVIAEDHQDVWFLRGCVALGLCLPRGSLRRCL